MITNKNEIDDSIGDNPKERRVFDDDYFISGDNHDNPLDNRCIKSSSPRGTFRNISFGANTGGHNEHLQGFPNLK
jgi:hypothetical protein